MKRLLFIICALLFVSAGAFAQVGAYSSTALDSSGKRISSPTVKVCAISDSACSTPVTIYKDSSSTSLSNPFTGDTQGNYTFFAAPGSYTVQVAKSGYSAYTYPATICGPTGYTMDASAQFGADMCAKIVAAANAVVSAGRDGAVIDAQNFHGTQACANGLNGWPWTPGSTPVLAARILLAPDVYIQTAVRFQVPTHTEVDGQTSHGNFFGSANYTGAWIGPANGYSDTVVVELGASNSSGATPPQGARLTNIGVTCQFSSGTSSLAASTGIINQYSQEFSGWDRVHISGCAVGFDIEHSGTLGGSINAGPYRNTHITMENVSDIATNGACYKIGTNSTATVQVGEISNVECSCTNSTGACPWMGYVDAHSVHFTGQHKLEQGAGGVTLATAHNVQDVTYEELMTVNQAGRTQSTPLKIQNTVREFRANVSIIGTNATTDAVEDASANGKGNVTIASQGISPNDLHFRYERSLSDRVITTLAGQSSFLATLNDVAITAGATLTAGDNQKHISAGATTDITETLPATVPAAPWEVWFLNSQGTPTTPSMLTIARNGILINGQGKDLCLTYRQSAHVYSNGGGTVYRAEISDPSTPIFTVPFSTTPTLSPFEHAQSITLTASVTSSTWAATCDGFEADLYIVENATGGFTFAYPANVVGQMTLNTAASKVNVQRFRYNATAAKWQAVTPGMSY